MTRVTKKNFEWPTLSSFSSVLGLAAIIWIKIQRIILASSRVNSSKESFQVNGIYSFLSLILSLRKKTQLQRRSIWKSSHTGSEEQTNVWLLGLPEFYLNDKAYAYRCHPNRRNSGGCNEWKSRRRL